MDGEAATLGDSANGFEQVFVAARARLHVDDYVRRNNLRDAFFHGVAGGVGLLQAGGARDADGDVHEIALAGAADPHTFADCKTPSVSSTAEVMCSRRPLRRDIEQRVHRAFAEPRADPDDHASDGQGRDGVQHAQPRDPELMPIHAPVMPRITTNVLQTSVEKCSASASSASLGYFCATRFRAARADKINSHADGENEDRLEARADVHRVEQQPLKGFPDDVQGGEKQQAGLDECGETFHFAVAIEMFGIGGLIRDAHGKIGDDGRDEIQDRMQRFGKNAQAAGDAPRGRPSGETSRTAEPTEASAARRFS